MIGNRIVTKFYNFFSELKDSSFYFDKNHQVPNLIDVSFMIYYCEISDYHRESQKFSEKI